MKLPFYCTVGCNLHFISKEYLYKECKKLINLINFKTKLQLLHSQSFSIQIAYLHISEVCILLDILHCKK